MDRNGLHDGEKLDVQNGARPERRLTQQEKSMGAKKARSGVRLAVWTITTMAPVLIMAGCGGSANPASPPPPPASSIAEGNWSITGASTANPGQLYIIGGHIKQSGSALTGQVGVSGPCDAQQFIQGFISTVTFTGSVSGNQFTFAFETASGA